MRALLNDCLRTIIAVGIRGLGLVLTFVQQVGARIFLRRQLRLKRRYGITSNTPVLTFGPELELLIESAAARAGHDAKFAWTSGSTGRPKRILYTKARLRTVKLAYVDFICRCCWQLGIKRTSLYVFSALSGADSLTSMLLKEKRMPRYLSSLQAPYRVHCHPAMQSLVSEYGATAVRLWILAIANPGILYCTNPSTLSIFLDALCSEWQRSARLIRDWCREPGVFNDAVHQIADRLQSRGSNHRLESIAKSDKPLSLEVCAPAVRAYICWEGGYVKPFVDRIATRLPPNRYRLLPMYSMSTETLETVGYFTGDTLAFLPMAPGVLYEFVEEGAAHEAQNLLTVKQLQVGMTYSMVVSDAYGLRRYQTGDLFICAGYAAGLPDLRFKSRRDLEYSFTGEKLTANHVMTTFERLRAEYPQLGAHKFLTCVPSHPIDESIPHYKIVMINSPDEAVGLPIDELATRCNDLLSEVNLEYKSKVASGRLGPVRFVCLSWEDFINRVSGSQYKVWEAQFKFLPLYRKTWEGLETSLSRLRRVVPASNC